MANDAVSQAIDFRSYYHLERYVFDTVSDRFSQDGVLNAFDFFCIIIWKANRAKSKVARRLLTSGKYADLNSAVRALTSAIRVAPSARDKLRVLIRDWKFALPIACAILTVLYPKDFTVYDVRVCEQLGDFGWVQTRTRYDDLWDGYEKYMAAVGAAAPTELDLRDKDRWLWGKSFSEQLRRDIDTNFVKAGEIQDSQPL